MYGGYCGPLGGVGGRSLLIPGCVIIGGGLLSLERRSKITPTRIKMKTIAPTIPPIIKSWLLVPATTGA